MAYWHHYLLGSSHTFWILSLHQEKAAFYSKDDALPWHYLSGVSAI